MRDVLIPGKIKTNLMSWYLEKSKPTFEYIRPLPCELRRHWRNNGIHRDSTCSTSAERSLKGTWKHVVVLALYVKQHCLCFQLQGAISRLTEPLHDLENYLSRTCPRKLRFTAQEKQRFLILGISSAQARPKQSAECAPGMERLAVTRIHFDFEKALGGRRGGE